MAARGRSFALGTLVVVESLIYPIAASTSATAAIPDGPASTAECAVLPRATMRVRLVLEPGVPPELRPQVESTVATVWRGEGLTVEWLPYSAPGETDRTTNLWLRITNNWLGASRSKAAATLGAVRFLGNRPHPDVLVSWPASRAWAEREQARPFRSVLATSAHEAALLFGGLDELARLAVGYAAAHEVGHFVLALKSHDRSGLMRRGLVPHVVAAVEDRDLELSSKSRQRLRERLAQGAACPTGVALAR